MSLTVSCRSKYANTMRSDWIMRTGSVIECWSNSRAESTSTSHWTLIYFSTLRTRDIEISRLWELEISKIHWDWKLEITKIYGPSTFINLCLCFCACLYFCACLCFRLGFLCLYLCFCACVCVFMFVFLCSCLCSCLCLWSCLCCCAHVCVCVF